MNSRPASIHHVRCSFWIWGQHETELTRATDPSGGHSKHHLAPLWVQWADSTSAVF